MGLPVEVYLRRPERGVYGICRGHRRRSSCHGRWRRCILVCHGQSEDCCRPLQILHDLETDEDVSPLATQQCGFGACVLDGQQNLHRASCGFGARHGRRPSFCVWIRSDSNHPEINLAKQNPPRWNTFVCICTLHDVTCSFVEPSLGELNSQREIRHHRVSPFTLILQTAICFLVII